MIQVEVLEEKVTLSDCPVGLFLSEDNELCLKTEYGLESYIVSSGERFWGGTTNEETLANVLVFPCNTKVQVSKPTYINKVYLRKRKKPKDVAEVFGLEKVFKNARTEIWENEDCRFSFDKSVIRVLIYDGQNKQLEEKIDNFFFGE